MDLFMSCRMRAAELVADFVSRLRGQSVTLRGMGLAVSEDQLKYVLMRGLPASYESLVQALGLQGTLGFDQIVDHLTDHQERESDSARERRRRPSWLRTPAAAVTAAAGPRATR